MTPERLAELRDEAHEHGFLAEALDEIERLRATIIHAATKHCGPQDKCEYWGHNEICEYLCDAIGYKDPDAEYDNP